MASTDGTSLEDLRAQAGRLNLELTDQELERLKPLYDHLDRQTRILHQLDLGEEEVAVTFSPELSPPGQSTTEAPQ